VPFGHDKPHNARYRKVLDANSCTAFARSACEGIYAELRLGDAAKNAMEVDLGPRCVDPQSPLAGWIPQAYNPGFRYDGSVCHEDPDLLCSPLRQSRGNLGMPWLRHGIEYMGTNPACINAPGESILDSQHFVQHLWLQCLPRTAHPAGLFRKSTPTWAFVVCVLIA
jgi:hypothetical protein